MANLFVKSSYKNPSRVRGIIVKYQIGVIWDWYRSIHPYNVILINRCCFSVTLEPCKHALGMQNRKIPNYAITASSMWDKNHGPHLGRLHFTARGHLQGAWSSRHNNRYQWFQVNFRRPTKVTSVLTQGRQNANQWVRQYRLAYSQDGLTWAYYKLRDSIKVREIGLSRSSA